MKLLDPQNVSRRATLMMENHIQLFQEHLGAFNTSDSSYYFGDDNHLIRIGYTTHNRLLSKIFSTQIHMALSGIEMAKDWEARSQFLGMWKIQGLIFRETNKDCHHVIESLNENSTLMLSLCSLMEASDLHHITMRYDHCSKKLFIDIFPYAGAFVWVKLPPVYHDIRMKPEEIQKISQITTLLKTYFSKNFSAKECFVH